MGNPRVLRPKCYGNDERCYGKDEPLLSSLPSYAELIRTWSWYNYFYTSEDAKDFAISYLKSLKDKADLVKKISKVDSHELHVIGWNCRILHTGGILPDDITNRMWKKLESLEPKVKKKDPADEFPKVDIQERIYKTTKTISDLESILDAYYTNSEECDIAKWFRDRAIKPQAAKKVISYYTPLYNEVYQAINGKDQDLKEGYSRWNKKTLKRYMEFIKSIISSAEICASSGIVKTRKPLAKKVKPASALVTKMKYMDKSDSYEIKSIKPESIIGCSTLIIFLPNSNKLGIINAMNDSGLSVRGSSITGYDENTSFVQILRNPKEVLPGLISSPKRSLKGILSNFKTVKRTFNGRININTVLLRVIG